MILPISEKIIEEAKKNQEITKKDVLIAILIKGMKTTSRKIRDADSDDDDDDDWGDADAEDDDYCSMKMKMKKYRKDYF